MQNITAESRLLQMLWAKCDKRRKLLPASHLSCCQGGKVVNCFGNGFPEQPDDDPSHIFVTNSNVEENLQSKTGYKVIFHNDTFFLLIFPVLYSHSSAYTAAGMGAAVQAEMPRAHSPQVSPPGL